MRPPIIVEEIYRQLHESKLTYQILAERSDDARARALLNRVSEDRDGLIKAFTHALVMDGNEVPLAATMAGLVDRIWLRVRDSIAHSDTTTMLADLLRAEVHLLDHYDSAVRSEGIAPHVLRALEAQRTRIEANISAIRGHQGEYA